MTEIITQLRDYCGCLPEMDDGELEGNVAELIHLISTMTCWAQQPCETFLNSGRTETLSLQKAEPCSCDSGVVSFEPYYRPFQEGTFKVSLAWQQGMEEKITELDPQDYRYSSNFGVLRINAGRYMADCGCCPGEYRLVVTYDAGYELIPECLLPLFCEMLQLIYDKNNCSCHDCQACENDSDVSIEYADGDRVSPEMEKYLTRLILDGHQKMMGLISLCGAGKGSIWGEVI